MGADLAAILLSFCAGVALWPCLEYALHEGLGHRGRGRNAFSREHLEHHAVRDYFAPAWKKALAAAPVLLGVWAASGLLLGWDNAAALTLGFATTYLAYEVLHRRCHVAPPTGPYSRWARKNHFHHHFVNPRSNLGVTTPLLDMLLGTYQEPDVVRVPERFAMRWLIDPATGDVREEFRGDYEIRRSRPGARSAGERQRDDLHAAYAAAAPSD